MMNFAFKGTDFEALTQYLAGPSAIAISDSDATAPLLPELLLQPLLPQMLRMRMLRLFLKDAQSVVLVDHRGLTVEQDTRLRKELREAGITYKVYKNTMMLTLFPQHLLSSAFTTIFYIGRSVKEKMRSPWNQW